jgi:diguanylate cyclase (GGDEF)-like protein/PAS domain S-box-containing protein
VFRVLACVANEHDLRLVLLAVTICAATSFTSFHAYSYVTRGQDARRAAWVFLTAVCTGAGIWATHFVAMLAYNPGAPTGYDPVLTVGSLLAATAVALAGFAIAARGGRRMAATGGAVIGAGIGCMHYMGMQALIVPGRIAWDSALVVSSILIGVVFASAALAIWHGSERHRAWLSPVLLTIAVCGLHFTAMGAATVVPDPTILLWPTQMNSSTLAVAIAAVTGLVMLTLLAMTLIAGSGEHEAHLCVQDLNARLEAQNRLLKEREEQLQTQNANLDMALSSMLQGLAMFDADERLILANRRYAELYGFTPDQIKPGATLAELIADRIANGLYKGLSVDDVLRNMRERIAKKRATRLTTTPGNGRTLQVSIAPRQPGGWVVTLEDVSERERLNARLTEQNRLLQEREDQLNQRNEQLDAALENMSQGLAMFDAAQHLIVCNRRYAEMYGLTPEQVKSGTTVRQIFEYRLANGYYQIRDSERFIESWSKDFGENSSRVQELANGRIINVSRRRTISGGRVVTHEDITEREQLNARLERQNALLKEHEEKLEKQNLVLDTALNNMVHGLAMYDAEQRLVICNRRFADMYALPSELTQPGTALRRIIEHRVARGEFPGESAEEVIRSARKRLAANESVEYVSQLGDTRHIAVTVQPMPAGGTVTTHYDITAQRRSEAKIEHMALHDTLTELPNRVLLNQRIEQALEEVEPGGVVAVHLLDLDNFKTVNDTLGHAAGDKLLKLVADRLRTLIRDTDTIARMGGDEFAIIQVAIGQSADATALAYRAIDTVGEPYLIEGREVVIGTSVGIAVAPTDGQTAEQLMRNADLALYRAKADGRRTYRFFEPDMDAQMQVRQALEDDLRKALPGGEFEVHYQPVVNLKSDDVSGFEALIRWRHPEKGLVAPGTFIPLAEEIGFIVPLGEWALREACAAAAKWPGDLKVAVNLSPVQFRGPGLVEVVVSALAASGLPAERLELEITENILLDDSEATISTLYQLRALGVRIALDDFGTGYASLSYLQSFPFDKIKIDRSFVKDIADGVGSLNIVRAVTAMAKGLGMTTTAEGVETKEQLEIVRAEGCTEIQGYLFSKPLEARGIRKFLRQWSKESARKGERAA